MSERKDYVLRVEHMDGTLSGGFHATDEDARMAARGWPEGTTTVHKLGPPISPPEPREWVVVTASGETFWSDGPLTRDEAERDLAMAEQAGSLGPHRLLRVVEDPA